MMYICRRNSVFWAFRMGPAATRRGLCDIVRVLYRVTKVGYIFPMVVISVLPLAGFGPSDYRKDAYHFKSRIKNWEVLARRKYIDNFVFFDFHYKRYIFAVPGLPNF